jgi:hypothetical protein
MCEAQRKGRFVLPHIDGLLPKEGTGSLRRKARVVMGRKDSTMSWYVDSVQYAPQIAMVLTSALRSVAT